MLSFPQKGNATPPRRNACARIAALHPALTFLVAFAFLTQNFIVQTHIHGVTQKVLTIISLGNTVTADAKKLPSLPDKENCPLCRLAAFVGSCVVPLAVLFQPADIAVLQPIPEPVQFGHVELLSHNWQGRAPPR